MGSSVDKRVVEMRFDNKTFESNAKQTMSTLSKLKVALSNLGSSKNSLSGLDKAGKTTALDSIANSVASLEKRFSTLGVIGMRVIQNLTDGLMNGLSKGLDFVSEGIVQGGIKRATNIENAHYQLQALLKDEDKVQAVMKNANDAVDGTAYSYDEAAKAAAMFAASGIKAGKPMENSLKGIVGTAAMTNAEFERISLIFTSVAGQGRLMGDQLLQLSSLGLNAPATIADYFNKIDDASTKASDEVRKAVKELSQGKKVTEADIRDLVSDGEIKFKIFAEAMYDAFGESAEKANETFQGAMSNIRSALARIGAGFISPLIKQNSSVIDLINRVREKINEVKSALVFDEELNNLNAYSKQFTDFVLSMANDLARFVENLDIASGMKVFYNVVDSVINVLKGLGSILAPIGKAFADVFLSFKVGDVINATASLKDFTSGLKISAEQSKNLHDVFEGVFNVIKLLADGFVGLLKAIFPLGDSVSSLGDAVLSLAGAAGRGLTAFSEWVRESSFVTSAFNTIRAGARFVSDAFVSLIGRVRSFVKEFDPINKVIGFIKDLKGSMSDFSESSGSSFDSVINKVKEFSNLDKIILTVGLVPALAILIKTIKKTKAEMESVKSISTIFEGIPQLFSSLKTVPRILNDLGGALKAYTANTKADVLKKSAEAILILAGAIAVLSLVDSKKALASAMGLSMLGAVLMFGVTKMIEAAGTGNTLTSMLNELARGLNVAFKNLSKAIKYKAIGSMIKDFAEGIAMVVASIVVIGLMRDKNQKALKAAEETVAVIAAVMAGMVAAINKLAGKVNTGRLIQMVISVIAVSETIKSLLGTLSDVFALDLPSDYKTKLEIIAGVFAGFISVLVIMDRLSVRDSDLSLKSTISLAVLLYTAVKSLQKVFDLDMPSDWGKRLGILAGVFTGLIVVVAALGKVSKSGTGGLKSSNILSVAVLLYTAVKSLQKVFDLDMPSDWGKRLGILAGVFTGLIVVVAALGKVSKSGTGGLKSSNILSVAVLLNSAVSAMKKVFEVNMPSNWEERLFILAGIFGGLVGVVAAINKVTKEGGSLKSSAMMVALAIDIVAIAGSLALLSGLDFGGMLSAAISIGIVLATLSTNIRAASNIANEDAFKTILSMAATVVSVAISLAILSDLSLEELLTAAGALSSVLLTLAGGLLAASKITNPDVYKPILALAATCVAIGVSLTVMADQPWDSLLAAAISMAGVLGAFIVAYNVIANHGEFNVSSAVAFLAMTLAVIPIGGALAILAAQPWQGLIASAVAVAGAIGAFTFAFEAISKANVKDITGAVSYLAMTLAVIPIGGALAILAAQPWQGLIASAVAVTATLAIFTTVFKIITSSNPNITAVVSFVSASLALIPIAAALDMLANQSWGGLISAAASLVIVVSSLALAMKAMSSAGGSLTGVLAFVAGAIALIPIAGVIKTLAEVPFESVVSGLIAMAGAMTVIAVAGALGSKVAPEIIAFSLALIASAAAMTTIGLAIPILVDGIVYMVETIIGSFYAVADIAPEVFEAGANIIAGLYNGIMSGANAVIEGIMSIGEGIIDGICSVLGIHSPSTILEAIGQNVDAGFINGIMGGSDAVNSAMESVFSGLTDQIDVSAFSEKGIEGVTGFASGLMSGDGDVKNVMQTITDMTGMDLSGYTQLGGDAVKNLENGMNSESQAAKDNLSKIVDSFGEVDVSALFKLGNDGVQGMDKGLKSGDPAVKQTVKELANVTGVDVSNYNALGKKAADVFIKGMKTGSSSGIKSTASSVAKELKSAIDSSVKGLNFTSAGKSITESMAKGIKSGASSVNSSAKSVAKSAADALKSQQSTFKSAGTQSMSAYASGLKSKSEEVTGAVKNTAKKATDLLKSEVKSFQKIGSDMISNVVKGISSKESEASNAAKDVASKIVSGLEGKVKTFQDPGKNAANTYIKALTSTLNSGTQNLVNQMTTVGRQIVQGVANGINANMGVARTAASNLAKAIDQQIKADLEIHSPSKVAEKRGKQVAEGLAKGIKGGVSEVKDASKMLTNIIRNDLLGITNLDPIGSSIDAIRKINNGLKLGYTIEELGISDLIVNNTAKKAANGLDSIGDSIKKINEGLKLGYTIDDIGISKVDTLSKLSNFNPFVGLTNVDLSKIKFTNFDPLGDSIKAVENISKAIRSGKTIEELGISDLIVNNTAKKASIGLESIGDAIRNINNALKLGYTIDDLGISNLISSTSNFDPLGDSIKAVENISKAIRSGKTIEELGISDLIVKRELTKEELKQQEEDIKQQEDKFWEDLLATKQIGADKEKYLDMGMSDFRKSILEEYTSIMDEYNQKVEQEKETVRGWYNPFQEVDKTSFKTREQIAEDNYQTSLKEAAAEDLRTLTEKKAQETSKSKKKTVQEETKVSQVQKENVISFTKMLKQQGEGYELFDKTWTSLQKKLKGTQLWDYVKEQGVDSLQMLLEIDQLSNKGLKKAIKQYDDNMADADKIAKKRSQEVAKSTKKAIKDLFEIDGTAKDKMAQEYLDSLTLEEQYWTKLLAVKQNGVDAEKYMSMEIQDFRKEMLDNAKDLMVNFNDQTEQIKQNMRDSFGIFSEINTESKISAEEILQNARDRANAFLEYKKIMDDLGTKLANTNVWKDYLSSMTISDIGNLKAVNGMTSDQLSQLAASWDRGTEAADKAAQSGIDKIKETTRQGLADLLNVPVEEINLDDFVNAFDGTAESLETVIMNIGNTVSNGKEEITSKAKEMMEDVKGAIDTGLEDIDKSIEENAPEVGGKVGEQIAEGIENSTEVVTQAAQSVAESASTAMASEESNFQKVGESAGGTYAGGVASKQPEAENAGTAVANSTLDGITSKNEAAANAGTGLAISTVTAINTLQSSFYQAGVNLAQGFIDGIGSMVAEAAATAERLASAAKDAIDKKLDINSPSRVMFESGKFTGIGFINGLMSCVDKAARASEEIVGGVTRGFDTGLSDILTDDLFTDPIIRPEVDLDNVYQSIDDICKLFNDAIQISAIDAEAINLNLTAKQRRANEKTNLQKKQNGEDAGNTIYNLIQNNYSPKALSEADIYRQTKNQFTMFRTVVARG